MIRLRHRKFCAAPNLWLARGAAGPASNTYLQVFRKAETEQK